MRSMRYLRSHGECKEEKRQRLYGSKAAIKPLSLFFFREQNYRRGGYGHCRSRVGRRSLWERAVDCP